MGVRSSWQQAEGRRLAYHLTPSSPVRLLDHTPSSECQPAAMPQLLLPLPPPAGSISMPGLEGTSSRRFGKGEGRFIEDLRSHLCHQSCSASFGAPETNRGGCTQAPTKRKPSGAAAYRASRPRGQSFSSPPEVHPYTCHCPQ